MEENERINILQFSLLSSMLNKEIKIEKIEEVIEENKLISILKHL